MKSFLRTIEIYPFKSNVFASKDIEFTAVENRPNLVKEIWRKSGLRLLLRTSSFCYCRLRFLFQE
jgi:hypothetical protein